MPLPRTFVGFSSTDIGHADTAIDSDFIALGAPASPSAPDFPTKFFSRNEFYVSKMHFSATC